MNEQTRPVQFVRARVAALNVGNVQMQDVSIGEVVLVDLYTKESKVAIAATGDLTPVETVVRVTNGKLLLWDCLEVLL